MDLVWMIPVIVLVVGALPILFAIARTAAEASALRGDLQNWSALRPALVETRTEAEELRRRVAALRAARR